MKSVVVKHFWKWFKLNSQAFLSLPKASPNRLQYWENEFKIHMAPYFGPNLGLDLLFTTDPKNAIAIITAYGYEEFFDQAEKIAEEAPYMKGWTFYTLYPPMGVGFMNPGCGEVRDFDPDELQFCPFDTIRDEGKCTLMVYADNEASIWKRHIAAVWDVVYNLLGERVTALNIEDIFLCPIETAPEEIQIALLPITDLPHWFIDENISGFIVDQNGVITRR